MALAIDELTRLVDGDIRTVDPEAWHRVEASLTARWIAFLVMQAEKRTGEPVRSEGPAGDDPSHEPESNPDATSTVERAADGPASNRSFTVPNGRMGQEYSFVIDDPGLSDLRMLSNGGTGLRFDPQSRLLHGSPARTGDARLLFAGLAAGRRVEIPADLAVIPDPRSLWVTVPSDRAAPFWKADDDFKEMHDGPLCIAASKRGRSHAREGSCRDDDFALWSDAEGWQVIVVADGAGSARYSRRGSQVAVTTVHDTLPQLLDQFLTKDLDRLVHAHVAGHPDAKTQIKRRLYQTMATAAFAAARNVEHEARRQRYDTEQFSTTLIVGIAHQTVEGWFLAGFSVGDGGAAVFDLDDGWVAGLTHADSGEYAGQTRFLHRSEFAGGFDEVSRRLSFTVRRKFTAMAVMTDGITDPKFPTEACFSDPASWSEFWTDLTAVVDLGADGGRRREQLMTWLDFFSPGDHDDRTLALLVPPAVDGS